MTAKGDKAPAGRQPEQTVIERLFEAVTRGELDQVLALVHPEGEWTPTAWSGEAMYRGRNGVRDWLLQFGADIEHLAVQVERVEVQGDRAVALGIVFDTRGSQKFSVEVPWSFVLEGGLIRRGCAHGSWEEAVRAAGLD